MLESKAELSRPVAPEAFTEAGTYRRTRLPVELASTLLPDAYTSQEFFEIERRKVLGTSWLVACTADEIEAPGDYFVADIAGQSVIVCRNSEGELRGFRNVCRHRGARLCDAGAGHVRRHFQCPYHAWAYDLNGSCLGTPLFEAASEVPVDQRGAFDMAGVKGFDRSDYGLHPVRVERFGPLVFACLDPDVLPLGEFLGDLPERLAGYRMDEWRVARTTSYEIRANYKLIGENFMEYYHLPWVHPGLVKVSPLKAHHRWQGSGMYVGFDTSPIAPNNDEGGWLGLPAITGLNDDDAISARFVWLFPNVALNVLPNHVFILVTHPVSAGHTNETAILLTNPEQGAGVDTDSHVDALMSFWDEVNREDIAIVERVQDGLGNLAYTGGRMCYRFEESLHRYQNMIADRMLDILRVPAGDDATTVPMFGPR